MTPKEKARELFKRYAKGKDEHGWFLCEFESCAKQCALIAVDEVLENVNYFFTELEKDGFPNKFDDEIEYWNEIKQEITKL